MEDMKLGIRYLGHAGFEISLDGVTIVVDPFISKNPSSNLKVSDVSKADIVAVTHAHFDHFGDAVEIAKRDSACFLGIYDTVEIAEREGVENVEAMNVGGACTVKGIEVACVPAFHTGNPCGFVFMGRGGSVYHAGDTGLFGDMRLIGDLYKPDVAMLPIGGRFTMGPQEAAIAVGLIRPRIAIPMHYNTFEAIRQDPAVFSGLVKDRDGTRVVIMREGERLEL